ncbi:MAG: hypothetical protein MH472_10485 [Bacteroidia bacterium]|nr:hypothetical protein [Bacteroidia bacterium]
MNYLSHYYVHQKNTSPLYSLGLIFPDISRGFVKNPGKLNTVHYQELAPLAEGCLQHYEADKQFHSSEFFDWGTKTCIELLKNTPFEGSVDRRWFMGHVLFEMLVDRILIRHKPKVGADFYSELRGIEHQMVKSFLELHEAREIEKFLKYFEHFRSAAYIQNYPDNNLFAFSFSKIMRKVGLDELSLTNKIILQECVLALEEGAFKNVQQLLFELKEIFKK